jgi:hypothetical protein
VKCCAGDLHGQIWGRVRAAATPRFGRKNEGKFDGATGGERKTRAGGGGGGGLKQRRPEGSPGMSCCCRVAGQWHTVSCGLGWVGEVAEGAGTGELFRRLQWLLQCPGRKEEMEGVESSYSLEVRVARGRGQE